jgi:trehalose/maltose hydrolase-like predicted phosphorylase
MDRDKMSNVYKGPSIDASYQVSVHLAEGFQRRRLKCEKLTDDGCQVVAKAFYSTKAYTTAVTRLIITQENATLKFLFITQIMPH